METSQESPQQQPLEGLEVLPEMIEQPPLEESHLLETLSQPQESSEIQPIEQQPLYSIRRRLIIRYMHMKKRKKC